MDRRRTVLAGFAVALTLLCYSHTIAGMAQQWWNDEDMGYAFVVPFVMSWIVWRERRWTSLKPEPSLWGLGILALGAGMQLAAAIGTGLFAGSLAFFISVTGVIVCLGGWAYVRAWSFPLLLWLFMLPKLAIVYNQVTLPMQLLASRMAASMLTATGYGVIRAGNILDVGGHSIFVAEACSGIRYLLPLAFTAVLVAYVLDKRVWLRWAMMALTIPLAIAANALRVAAAAALPVLTEGTPHMLLGAVIFLFCVAALLAVQRLLSAFGAGVHA